MGFKLVGDGTNTSSVAITTLSFTTVEPALPAQHIETPRSLLFTTEAGVAHGYVLGEPRRSWTIGLRLLTALQERQLRTALQTIEHNGWCMWELASGTFEAGAVGSAIDTALDYNHLNEWKGKVVVTTGGTGSGQVRRVSSSTNAAPGTTLNVSPVFGTAPDATTTYVLGWPVRWVGDLSRESVPPSLCNVDFRFEEMLLADTTA